MKLKERIKNNIDLTFLASLFLIVSCLTTIIYGIGLTGPVIKSDGEGYYIYLPSFYIHEDLNSQKYMEEEFATYDFETVRDTVNG